MMMKNIGKKAIALLLFFTIICGGLYTVIVTGIGQLLFPVPANGSLIVHNGVLVRSQFIGQPYRAMDHLWGRPSILDVKTYKDDEDSSLLYGGPSNDSPTSVNYSQLIQSRLAYMRHNHPEMGNTPVPVDLITVSASGLDPDISFAAASYQVGRIARYKKISSEKVRESIEVSRHPKIGGVFGEDTVNVGQVNQLLDEI